MKPNKPGEWYNRCGQRILVYRGCDCCDLRWHDIDSNSSFYLADLNGDDWLPATPPTFPERPSKPQIFHCYTTFGWRSFTPDGHCVTHGNHSMTARMYVVVPHPDNDPEVVRLIEEAQK